MSQFHIILHFNIKIVHINVQANAQNFLSSVMWNFAVGWLQQQMGKV